MNSEISDQSNCKFKGSTLSSLFILLTGILTGILIGMAIPRSPIHLSNTAPSTTVDEFGSTTQVVQAPKRLLAEHATLAPHAELLKKIQAATIAPSKATTHWHHLTVKQGESLSSIFKVFNIPAQTLVNLLKQPEAKRLLPKLKPKQHLSLHVDDQNDLLELLFDCSVGRTLQLVSTDRLKAGTFEAHIIETPLTHQLLYHSGTIKNNLSVAAETQGVPCKILQKMIQIFESHIDFRRDIHPKDRFGVLYEARYLKGKPIGVGHLIAARLTLRNRQQTAVRYALANGEAGYFNLEGDNLASHFSRFPLHFTRISSRFMKHRWHPILHIYRSHLGVDLVAPRETPVKATADGRMIAKGRAGGYGNRIVVQHGRQYRTLYAHLSRFAGDVHVGQQIQRGRVIAYVGATGLATAPHLHYEFRSNNEPQNPLKVQLPHAPSVPKRELAAFRHYAKAVLKQFTNKGA